MLGNSRHIFLARNLRTTTEALLEFSRYNQVSFPFNAILMSRKRNNLNVAKPNAWEQSPYLFSQVFTHNKRSFA